MGSESVYERVYALVRQIPPGRVATYGQVAAVLDRCTPRMVGWAMAAAPSDVPWQRVINSRGRISPRSDGSGTERQRRILEEEGVRFDRTGRVDLREFAWLPAGS